MKEKLTINEEKWTKKPIPRFSNKQGAGKYRSFNAALRGKVPPPASEIKSKAKIKPKPNRFPSRSPLVG